MSDVVADLGFRPRPWQERVFKSLSRFSVLVVHRRGGKTILSILKLIDSALRFGGEMGRFAYIAPELKQAKGIAWDYLKLYSRRLNDDATIINESELWVQFRNGSRIRLYGADNPDNLRGMYFDGVVIDEVSQMKPEMWTLVLIPALSDRRGWALFIGTPEGVNLLSRLYYNAQKDPEWYADLYNYLQTGALGESEIEEMRKEMSPNEFRQELLCDFNATSDNVLISLDEANAAANRGIRKDKYDFAAVVLGVDVAWQGGDKSVVMRRQGLQAFTPLIFPGIPEKNFAGRIAGICERDKVDMTFIDITGGYGGEVLSRLTDLGFRAVGVKFSEAADNERFMNKRAEMWFKMADWIKEGSIPNDPALIAELCAPTYSNDNASMRLKLESKDDIRERLGRSPDIADALALTFAFPVAPKRDPVTGEAGAWTPNQMEIYNPFKKADSGPPVYNPFARKNK